MKRKIAWTLALCLLALSLLTPASLAFEKSEIVYVNLRCSGDLDEIHIVNRFETDTQESLVDYGAYYQVTNLTDTSELTLEADCVRLTLSGGTLFYQGDPVSASLPWRFQLNYQLDGAPIRAEDLSGKSGKLEMRLTIGEGDEALAEFYEHYALSITVTLDGELCKNISADDATIANSGMDRLLTYTVLPSPDTTYTITADVTDFSMSDISINAVPLGMEVDIDTSEIDDKLSDLESGVSRLGHGSSDLASGASDLHQGVADLQSGTLTLAEGTEALVSGAAEFSTGLDTAKSGSARLAASTAQIVAAIDAFEAQSGGGQDISIGEMRDLCNRLLSVLGKLETILNNLDKKLSGLGGSAQSQQEKAQELLDLIDGLSVSESDIALLKTLLQKAAGNSDVSSALASEIAALKRVLASASNLNDQLAAIKACAAEILKQAQALGDPLSDLTGDIATAKSDLATAKAALQAILSLLDALEAGGASADDGVVSSIFSSIRQLNSGMQALDSGIGQLQISFAQLSAGISSVDAGVDSLASGADTLLSGSGALVSGANKLDNGVNKLENSTGDMDAKVEEGVDDAVSSITGGDFDPISYADARNTVSAVQFAIRIPGVEEAEEEEAPAEAEQEKGFWEKLMDLFQ